MACAICQTRRPRRFCPGIRGDICSICCGTEREVTVSCPLDCEYLQDARRHDRPVPIDPAQVPNRDIEVFESFLSKNEALLVSTGRALVTAAFDTAGAVDFDAREALDGLIRTYRTLESGVYYESRPQNPLAARIFDAVQEGLTEFRNAERQSLGMTKTRDSDVIRVLVFLQRIELDRNNGRARGRAFLDAMRGFYPPEEDSAQAVGSSLIIP
jgi:hypothetical protein